jgi:hypothetical protein
MLELWVLAANEAGQSEAAATLYRKFGPKAIDDAFRRSKGIAIGYAAFASMAAQTSPIDPAQPEISGPIRPLIQAPAHFAHRSSRDREFGIFHRSATRFDAAVTGR